MEEAWNRKEKKKSLQTAKRQDFLNLIRTIYQKPLEESRRNYMAIRKD